MSESAMESLIQALKSSEADAFLIGSEVNRRYFTGFAATDGWLLVTADGAELLMDSRYTEAAQQQARNCTVVAFSNIYETLRERLSAHNARSMMLEQAKTSLAEWAMMQRQLPEIRLIDSPLLDDRITAMRAIKTPAELRSLAQAQALTEEGFHHMLDYLRPGITERDAALELEFYMRKRGAECVAFDFIVVSGEKTSMPHGVPGDRVISRGDFVTMDTGVVIDGMHSDMTRTVAIGSVSDEQRKVYEIVRAAQAAGIAAARAGVNCRDVDAATRKVIDDAGYGPYFGHSTGHSVGMEIHEMPCFSPRSSDVAKENMVITVEPGIYLPGKFGVRIEDMVRITPTGCEDLTHAEKDLIIL